MSDNLVLELLRVIRADIAGLASQLDHHGRRLGRIEITIASLRRDQALDTKMRAESDVRFDQLTARVARIERRLDMVDAPA